MKKWVTGVLVLLVVIVVGVSLARQRGGTIVPDYKREEREGAAPDAEAGRVDLDREPASG
jgi:UPF0716 family protein affecting phage T7 exclusion